MNVTISFDEHKVRNAEKIEDIKVLMLKGEKGDAGMTPEDVMDVVEPYLANYAPLNSPALTGTPTAPTATAGSDTTQIATTAYVKNEVDSKLSSTYKAKGSVAFASLPSLIAANEGNVYNVTDAFTTTNDFVEGSGKSYPAGTNVVIVNTTGTTYKYDVLSGFVDLSGYLTASDAANTYLSQSDAADTYATQTALNNTNAKVGSGTLDVGSDLIDAANTLNTGLTTLNSKMSNYYDGSDNNLVYKASKSNGIVTMTIELRGVTASPNAIITTLPQVLRPKTDTAILINVNQSYQYLGIRSNGTIYSNQALSSAFSVIVIMYETSI